MSTHPDRTSAGTGVDAGAVSPRTGTTDGTGSAPAGRPAEERR
jgi:hypothetical protein